MKVVKLYLYPIFFARFAIFEGSTSSKFKYQLPLSTVFVSEKLVDVKLQKIYHSIVISSLTLYYILILLLSKTLDNISVKIWNKIILRVFYILINKLQTKRNWPTTWSVLFDSNCIGLFDIFSFFFFFSSWLKSLHSDRQKDVYLHIVSSFDNVL